MDYRGLLTGQFSFVVWSIVRLGATPCVHNCGRISFCAKSRAVCRIISCSSEKPKSIVLLLPTAQISPVCYEHNAEVIKNQSSGSDVLQQCHGSHFVFGVELHNANSLRGAR